MTDDGWKTVYFGKPYLVSLLAAPAVALFGADGFVATNMALLLVCRSGSAPSTSGSATATDWRSSSPAGFFLLSNAFAYVFWIHTEVLCIAAVTACLYLRLQADVAGDPDHDAGGAALALVWNDAARPAWSGAAIVVGGLQQADARRSWASRRSISPSGAPASAAPRPGSPARRPRPSWSAVSPSR